MLDQLPIDLIRSICLSNAENFHQLTLTNKAINAALKPIITKIIKARALITLPTITLLKNKLRADGFARLMSGNGKLVLSIGVWLDVQLWSISNNNNITYICISPDEFYIGESCHESIEDVMFYETGVQRNDISDIRSLIRA